MHFAGFLVSVEQQGGKIARLVVESTDDGRNRTKGTAFFGSNDGKAWTQLTEPLGVAPTELTRVEVGSGLESRRFRYLKIEKTSRQSAGLFEPSELRIHGQRVEAR